MAGRWAHTLLLHSAAWGWIHLSFAASSLFFLNTAISWPHHQCALDRHSGLRLSPPHHGHPSPCRRKSPSPQGARACRPAVLREASPAAGTAFCPPRFRQGRHVASRCPWRPRAALQLPGHRTGQGDAQISTQGCSCCEEATGGVRSAPTD